jgi:hypothetical protein
VEVLSSERRASRHITHLVGIMREPLESCVSWVLHVTAFTEKHPLVIKESRSNLRNPSLL